MPKAYWFTCYRAIKDPDRLAAYAKTAAGQKERIVISEFPSLDKAIAAHESPATNRRYARSATARCATSRIIEGLA